MPHKRLTVSRLARLTEPLRLNDTLIAPPEGYGELSSDAYNPLGIFPSLLHAGIGPYLVEEDGVSELLFFVFRLIRLGGIRQF